MKLIARLLVAYRVLALTTGVLVVPLVGLWLYGLVAGGGGAPTWLAISHGWLFMVYVIVTLVLAERCRWRPIRVVLIALAGTVPFASFFAERKVTRMVREESLSSV